ncbi:MAG: enoyl-CoA hydratase/isomerase family protein [Bacteroidetes bacterium]|nr:enoyl-CoA hydratase/isomerase family protein [Bacteroidota bacterium]
MLYLTEQVQNIKSYHFAHLLMEEKNHVLTITLNRPEKKNALNDIMTRELAFALSYARTNHQIWVVVIAAKGNIFCAGADLKAMLGEQQESASTVPEANGEIVIGNVFNALHKPCIAKVHAPVYAGGFLIICGCTHVISVDDAIFSLPEVKLGLYPFQVMQSMLQIMPPRQVLDACMRAKTFTAAEAEKAGLVSKVVSQEKLDAAVQALADELMQYSPSGIRLGLEAFENLKSVPAEEAHAYMKQMFGEAQRTDDAKEGLLAFKEKRKPVWKG